MLRFKCESKVGKVFKIIFSILLVFFALFVILLISVGIFETKELASLILPTVAVSIVTALFTEFIKMSLVYHWWINYEGDKGCSFCCRGCLRINKPKRIGYQLNMLTQILIIIKEVK